ncbi:MAG: hypothetical protein LM600_04705 [Thaumarchaeota archaeon]|nr:hypothetical protein [Nitrososphaerota archaeon]
MTVKLKDTVRLSELALNVYRNLRPEEYVGKLAPSLGLTVQRDLGVSNVTVSYEFLDPLTFLLLTHFREPVKEALRVVNTALQSVGGGIVLSLTHAMGLGKTHFLTILYHLYVNIPDRWDGLEEIATRRPGIEDLLKTLRDINYKVDIARKTLVIPIDLKYLPTGYNHYEALFEYLKRVLERKRSWLKQEISEKKLVGFENLLSELSKYKPREAARAFSEALRGLGIVTPVLILVDELYASVAETIIGESRSDADNLRSVLVFISSLVDELQGKEPVVLIYASAQQDVQRWKNVKEFYVKEEWAKLLKEAVSLFEDRMQRFSVRSVKDVTEEEAFEIVKKRIIEFQAPLSSVLREFEKVKHVLADIVGADVANSFVEKLKLTYPFSPTYEEFVRKLIVPVYGGDLSNAQHLRDLIKISSSALGRALEDEESSLVSIAHIEHEDIKHCLQEDSAKLWWSNVVSWDRYIDNTYKDPVEKKMLKRAVRSIYVKSVTDNVIDLIEMLRLKPETLTPENISRRALHQRDLILSLVGVVDVDELHKSFRVLDELENIPYIHVIRRDDARYYLASFVGNPLQMISSMRDEILRKLRDERGQLDVAKVLNYLGEKLKERELVSRFKEKAPLDFEFVKLEDFNTNDFLKYIDSSIFTVLVLSPLDIAEKMLLKGMSDKEVLNRVKQALERNKNEIKTLNMFAVVISLIDKGSLERLLTSLASIEASESALKIFTSTEALNIIASQEVERRRDLRDYMTRRGLTEDELRRIVIEIIVKLKERLESFAQQLTTISVQDFVSEYTGLFKEIISYDPVSEAFVDKPITVKVEGEVKVLDKVFAATPVWIANTIMSILNVKHSSDIKAQLQHWIKRLVKEEHVREKLIEKGMFELEAESIREALIRGWREIPIKPRSIEDIEVAIKDLNGVIIMDDVLGKIELVVETVNGVSKRIILKKKLVLPPPRPLPKGVVGFTIMDVDDVSIFLNSLTTAHRSVLFEKIRILHLHVELEEREVEKKAATIDIEGSTEVILDFVEPLTKYFNRYRNSIKQCNLQVKLASEVSEETVVQELKRLGIKTDRVTLQRASM